MTPIDRPNYSALDRPEILAFLFHPRPEGFTPPASDDRRQDFLIPVADDIRIGARLHHADPAAPTILFFHGNGEIVADYDDLAPLYNDMGINFFPVDYRGYGRSSGSPSVSGMMTDCHRIYDFVTHWLSDHGYTGRFIVMGRSLGSASALEVAAHNPDAIDALVIESGFAYALPLLRLLGIDVDALGLSEQEGLQNIERVRRIEKPALFIHAEYDHIIPFADAEALYSACPSIDKTLLKIPGADHNTIFHLGIREYMAAVREIAIPA